jgi:hypothetical protein
MQTADVYTENRGVVMPVIHVHVSVTVDGRELPWCPINAVADVDEYQPFNYTEAADGDSTTFSALPIGEVDTVSTTSLTDTNITVNVPDASTASRLRGIAGGT